MDVEGLSSADDSRVLRQIIEATPNAMLMVDATGRIVLVNSETERLFGYDRDELLTMNVEGLIPERFRGRHPGYRSGFFAELSVRAMGAGRELFGRHRDGSEIPVEIGLNPINIRGKQMVLASVIDITARLVVQRAESAAIADRLRRSILDSLPFSIVASNPDGTIVEANPAAEQLLGYGRGELIGSTTASLRLSTAAAKPVATTTEGIEEHEVDYRRKDGSIVPVNEAVTPIVGSDGEVTGRLSVAYDITQRRQAEESVRHLAHHDFLTDLPNRTMLFDRLESDLRFAARYRTGVAVVMIDLDHFKRVNDTLGHHVGDELLLRAAERLREHVRAGDMVARLGGDEFVVVFNDVSSRDLIQQRLARILEAIPAPMSCAGHELVVTASLGAAMFPEHGHDPATLLRHADTAMYHAKSAGRNALEWFQPSMLDENNDKVALAASLRHALDREEICVSYQTQVSLATGQVVGVEALARWSDDEGRPIAPERFIPVAEDNGLINRLGEWVLRRACQDTIDVSERLGRRLTLAVNVSPRQVQDRDWMDVLTAVLADTGLEPERLELEITEGVFLDNAIEVVDVLQRMRALGVSIVIDDFGTGFSSLAYLTRFPIDKIKIDRSFIADVDNDAADAAIVDTIIVMAHTLGMTVVGEGVETEPQERYLRERGCDEAQGFLYSEAVPAAELAGAIT